MKALKGWCFGVLLWYLCFLELSFGLNTISPYWTKDELVQALENKGLPSGEAKGYTEIILESYDLSKDIPSLHHMKKNVIQDHFIAYTVWTTLHDLRIDSGGGMYKQTMEKLHIGPVFMPQRMIFSINAGRSGSNYLASLLDSCQKVLGLHEPPPGLGGSKDMHNTLLEDSFKERHTLKIKSIFHDMTVDHKRRGSVIYAETNPNFKVWFWDVVIEDFACQRQIPMDILIVRKYIPAVLKSILSLGWFMRDGRPVGWLPTANSVNSPVQALAPDTQMDEYDKVISYLLFTEGMAQHIKQRYRATGQDGRSKSCPSLRFLEFRSEQLYTPQGALYMLTSLGLTITDETRKLAGVKMDKMRLGDHGTGKLKPTAVKRKISLEECEKRVAEYLEKARSLGIMIPELPHFQPYPGYDYEK